MIAPTHGMHYIFLTGIFFAYEVEARSDDPYLDKLFSGR